MEKTDWKAKAEMYAIEAEAFSLFYEESINRMRVFLVFAGIITKMQSDLIVYEKKNGLDKTKDLRDRVEALKAIYHDLSGLSEQNLRLKNQLSDNTAKMLQMEVDNCKMRLQLEANEKAFNQE